MGEEIEGIEGGAAEVDAPGSATEAADLARHVLERGAAEAGLTTVQLATACAELDLIIDAEASATKLKAARLNVARQLLAERFTTEGVSQVRVTTSAGRRLVHLASVFAPTVPADQRPVVLAWLKANHPELVAEAYSDATLKARLKAWQAAQEGEFPQALVDAGAIKIYQGVEVRFRQSK